MPEVGKVLELIDKYIHEAPPRNRGDVRRCGVMISRTRKTKVDFDALDVHGEDRSLQLACDDLVEKARKTIEKYPNSYSELRYFIGLVDQL